MAFIQTFCLCATSQVYTQLAEDDKIRYKNEMKSWEEHMADIGRDDLIREQTLSAKKKLAAKTPAVKKPTKKAKARKAAATGKTKATRKTTKSSSKQTVRTTKTKTPKTT